MNTTLYGYGMVVCALCVAAIVGYARNSIEERKHRLFKLQFEYQNIRIERKLFETKNGTTYPACSDPHYQALLRTEASALIYIMLHYPKTYARLEPKLTRLLVKIDDQKIT